MNLDKNTIICGHPAEFIRKVLRGLKAVEFGHTFRKDMEEKAAEELFTQLENEEYISFDYTTDNVRSISITVKGRILAEAVFTASIKRKTADKRIAELIRRAIRINASGDYLYTVKRMFVFGSYLSGKERLGDVNVDVVLEPRYPEDIQNQKEQGYISYAIFKIFHDRDYYLPICALDRVKGYLKNRSTSLRLHYGEVSLEHCRHEVIYEKA